MAAPGRGVVGQRSIHPFEALICPNALRLHMSAAELSLGVGAVGLYFVMEVVLYR